MLIRPSVRLGVLPPARPLIDRFRLAAAVGFEGIELEAGSGPAAAISEAADRAGLAVHSVHCLAHYACPLSSPDPAVRSAGVDATVNAIHYARALGADTLLLIPGVVSADASYGEVFSRSQEVIGRDLLPVAAGEGIVLAVENVWNGFLLSPFDYARYIDEFASPWLRAYLDVGNIIFGRPEGWIDILGRRICKLHLKDSYFRHDAGRFGPAKIGEGDIDWTKVRAALGRIGFEGWGVLAEPELAQRGIARRVHGRIMRRRSGAPAIPSAALGVVQDRLTRRLLEDVMRRFRSHIVG